MKRIIPILLLALLLTACSKKTADQAAPTVSGDNAVPAANEEVLEKTIGDKFTAAATLTGEDDAPAFLKEMEGLSGYEIVTFDQNGDVADAVIKVRSPDLAQAIAAVEGKGYSSEEEINRALADALAQADVLETELTVQFVYNGEKWEPVITGEFFDAYYGGILTIRSQYYEENWEGSGAG